MLNMIEWIAPALALSLVAIALSPQQLLDDGFQLSLLAAAVWISIVAVLRFSRRWYLQTLEGQEDPHPLAWSIAFLEFPFMFEAGTSFGFFATFAVPSISAVLAGSKGFSTCPQVRYDDTAILMHEIGEFGPRSERGRAAIARVNEIHGRHRGITRDDMAFTLWVFTFEPQRWIDRYEWRRLRPGERRALWCFWREVGQGLKIANLPVEEGDFYSWGRNYASTKFSFRRSNRDLTNMVVLAASRWGFPTSSTAAKEVQGFPQPSASDSLSVRLKQRILLTSICALCPDAHLLEGVGLSREAAAVPRMVAMLLKISVAFRGLFIGIFMPPRPTWLPGTLLGVSVSQSSKTPPSHSGDDPAYMFSCPRHFLSYRISGQYRLSDLGRPASHYQNLQEERGPDKDQRPGGGHLR